MEFDALIENCKLLIANLLISGGNIALRDFLGHMHVLCAAAVHVSRAALLGIEVVLSRLARNELPRTGDLEAFGK